MVDLGQIASESLINGYIELWHSNDISIKKCIYAVISFNIETHTNIEETIKFLEQIEMFIEELNYYIDIAARANNHQIYLVLLKKKEQLNGFALEQNERRFEL